MRKLRLLAVVIASLSLLAINLPQGQADSEESLPLDLAKLTSFYAPLPDLANLNNWRSFNSYNTVHFVATQLPNRQPDDQTTNDPFGDQPQCQVIGDIRDIGCQYNHQLEYLSWFETAYTEVLSDFGVTFRTHQFHSAGDTGGTNFSTNAGRAFNKFAIVPGVDHPEDFVLIGSHYDGVDGSPYAAWDSTAGSGTMLRTAKVLADYWEATGTRPSKTVIFAAWDAEEAGGLGSKLYVGTKNNRSSQNGMLPKDPDVTVTSYINHDPCGGNYPAMYRGSPVSRNAYAEKTGFIPMVVALHAPAGTTEERARMTSFNSSVSPFVNQLFNAIDDTLPVTNVQGTPAEVPVFLSTEEATAMGSAVLAQESLLRVNTDSLIGFTTDAEDFHPWIPTLNPYPDNLPRNGQPPASFSSADAFFAYHTPHDNFEQLVAQTSPDPSGQTYSKGLSMSFELCAMLSAGTMLQPTQGGSQVVTDEPVAWFENINPNVNGGTHTYDATGSYRYADPATRTFDETLEYSWDLGDGTTATGPVVTHTYGDSTSHHVTLTVTDPETLQFDTMTMKIGTAL